MPPAFNADERERITRLLREAGFRLFTTQGLRKTSLDELVRPAGIAKSSFYAFYDSKEELFIDLMYQQVPELNVRLFALLEDESVDMAESFRRFMYGVLDIQQNNPLYRRVLTNPDEMEALFRKLSPERLADTKRLLIDPILEFIDHARKNGHLVDVEPAIVLGVVQAVMVVPLQEHLLDPETYQPALELLIDLVATGLTRT